MTGGDDWRGDWVSGDRSVTNGSPPETSLNQVNGPTDVDGDPAWREAGSGDAIVLLHGLGGSRTAWEPQLADLGARWRCIAWDMPGYGASPPVHPLTFPAIADAVVRLLDAAEVEAAHLCGLSFGGQHALHAALAHPDRVRSLVLADTSPAFGLDGTDPDQWRRARTDALDAGRTPADIADAVIRSVAGPGFTGAEFDRTVAAFGRISSDGLRAACHCLPTHDVRDRLDRITCPTLVIQGELDRETPLAYARALADGIADARLEVIAGVGHLTPAEAPERFNELVAAFVEACQ